MQPFQPPLIAEDPFRWGSGHPVQEMECMRHAALVQRDHNAIADLLCDDLRYTHSTGTTHDKPSYLAYLDSGPRFERIDLTEAQVLDLGVAVVLSGTMVLRFQAANSQLVQEVQSTVIEVWLYQKGSWKLSVLQSTRKE